MYVHNNMGVECMAWDQVAANNTARQGCNDCSVFDWENWGVARGGTLY